MAGTETPTPPGTAPFSGYYINLDRSPERRARMEHRLTEAGLGGGLYRRFAATDGANLTPRPGRTPGERGCFHSHMSVLTEAALASRPVHIIEDDAVPSRHLLPTIAMMEKFGVLSAQDIVFTETFVPPDMQVIKAMMAMYRKAHAGPDGAFDPAAIQIVDLAATQFAGATSYVVNPKSIPRLLQLYRKEWETGPTLAFDLFLRREVQQRRIKAACLVPFVTSLDLDEVGRSTITGRFKPPAGAPQPAAANSNVRGSDTPLVMALLRNSFFVERDLAGTAHPLIDEIRARTLGKDDTTHLALIEKALGYILSDNFRNF